MPFPLAAREHQGDANDRLKTKRDLDCRKERIGKRKELPRLPHDDIGEMGKEQRHSKNDVKSLRLSERIVRHESQRTALMKPHQPCSQESECHEENFGPAEKSPGQQKVGNSGKAAEVGG